MNKNLRMIEIIHPQKMNLKKLGSGAEGLAMSALAAAPAFGENLEARERPLSEPYRVADLVVAQIDCVADVKIQRDLAAQSDEPLSRRDMKSLLNICGTENIEAAIAAEKEVIARLQTQIEQHQLQINEANEIRRSNGELVALIAIIDGQIVLLQANTAETDARRAEIQERRAEIEAESDQVLEDFEQILIDFIS